MGESVLADFCSWRTQGWREKHLGWVDLRRRALSRHRRDGEREEQSSEDKLRERRDFFPLLSGVVYTSAGTHKQGALEARTVMAMLLAV